MVEMSGIEPESKSGLQSDSIHAFLYLQISIEREDIKTLTI